LVGNVENNGMSKEGVQNTPNIISLLAKKLGAYSLNLSGEIQVGKAFL
jgi:hypothetical protein